jgi:hypothetical protein
VSAGTDGLMRHSFKQKRKELSPGCQTGHSAMQDPRHRYGSRSTSSHLTAGPIRRPGLSSGCQVNSLSCDPPALLGDSKSSTISGGGSAAPSALMIEIVGDPGLTAEATLVPALRAWTCGCTQPREWPDLEPRRGATRGSPARKRREMRRIPPERRRCDNRPL